MICGVQLPNVKKARKKAFCSLVLELKVLVFEHCTRVEGNFSAFFCFMITIIDARQRLIFDKQKDTYGLALV